MKLFSVASCMELKLWALLAPIEAAGRFNLSSEDGTVKHVKDLQMKLGECCPKAEEIRDEMDKAVFWNVK